MNKKLPWILGVVVVVLVVAIMAWRSEEAPTSSIKIGAVLSETGAAAAYGEMSRDGIEMAANEINAQGGVNGRKVDVLYEDDQTDPKTAVGVYQKFTSIDHVDAVIGSNFDFVSIPIFALAKTQGTVVVSPSNPRIPGSLDTNANSFVMMSDFSKIIENLQPYMAAHPYKQLAVIHLQSGFGAEIAKTLGGINQNLGKPAMIEEIYQEIGGNDFRTMILKLKSAGVDVVYVDAVDPDILTFVNQAKQLGFAPRIMMETAVKDTLATPGVNRSLLNGIIVLDWDIMPSSFAQKFEALYHRAPDNSANRAYDATYILADAVAKNNGGTGLASVLEATQFTTPNGPFSFTSDHAASSTPVAIEAINNGQLITQ